ncbi:RNA 3'-terminal phosphate cyclase/enolpyruvate transferase [Penicillium sp. IBT 35674x]|nr:RNA 3'-terminal phosphate cyclase/enolpyruvate transferase [Penicillium sp. IBT 35674x]
MSTGIVINGGSQVTGGIHVSGSKNSGLALMAAALLSTGTIVLSGMSPVSDIKNMSRILQCLGAEVSSVDDALQIATKNTKFQSIPEELSARLRASILVLGPLLGRFGRAKLSLPGGCTIGVRPIEEHIRGLEKLGARVKMDDQYIEAHASRLHGATIHMQTPSVTGTMNLIMASCLARGVTQIHNAAREPEVVDLANFLISMGAQINGLGTPHLTIIGRHELLSPCRYQVMKDRIEAGTFLVLGAIAGDSLTVHGCKAEHQTMLIKKLRAVGAIINISVDSVTVHKAERLLAVDIRTGPYPAFPTDLQPQFMVLLSLAHGISQIVETIYERRFDQAFGLQAMGADIQIHEQTAIVSGVRRLSAALVSGSDLRSAASLVLAAIVAEGISVVQGTKYIDRGYHDLESKLAKIGITLHRSHEIRCIDNFETKLIVSAL